MVRLALLAASALLAAVPTAAQDALPAAVLAELNRVRTDPRGFAASLRDYRARIGADNIVRLPGRAEGILLAEGRRAVDEAIAALEAQPPLGALTADPLLAAAAGDFAAEQGRTGAVGHVAADGATLADRIARHGRWAAEIAETIGYGYDDPLLVAIQLIVDDNVPGRGHRAVILDPRLRFAGAACAAHRVWRHACVVDWSAAAVRPSR